MTNLTAKFSNGFEDTYKGKRDIKAAWMITDRETGEVIASGHSLNRECAEKTAKSTASNLAPNKVGMPTGRGYAWSMSLCKSMVKSLRSVGAGDRLKGKAYQDVKDIATQWNADKRDEYMATIKIEIVNV